MMHRIVSGAEMITVGHNAITVNAGRQGPKKEIGDYRIWLFLCLSNGGVSECFAWTTGVGENFLHDPNRSK